VQHGLNLVFQQDALQPPLVEKDRRSSKDPSERLGRGRIEVAQCMAGA
jgi:hypothetical protein